MTNTTMNTGAASLSDEQIDFIANDGRRNAAGGIYATRVYEFARAIETEVRASLATPIPQVDDAPTPKQAPWLYVEEVKQLCRDYSSRNGSVYIQDVESSLDGLAKQPLSDAYNGGDTDRAGIAAGGAQEPFGYFQRVKFGDAFMSEQVAAEYKTNSDVFALYAAPQAPATVALTDERIDWIADNVIGPGSRISYAKAREFARALLA